MKLRNLGAALALSAGLGLSGQAFAGTVTVFSNPLVSGGNQNCAFATACGSFGPFGDDFAGQAFTLSSSASINAASFVTHSVSSGPIGSANWAIYQANGAGGLPGTLVASGAGEPLSPTLLGGGYSAENFGLGGNVDLSSGSYYFAVQVDSALIWLMQGQNGGAVETHDGGSTWSNSYEGINGVAVSLYDVTGVPEPATWAMLILGVAMIGFAARRRSEGVALTA